MSPEKQGAFLQGWPCPEITSQQDWTEGENETMGDDDKKGGHCPLWASLGLGNGLHARGAHTLPRERLPGHEKTEDTVALPRSAPIPGWSVLVACPSSAVVTLSPATFPSSDHRALCQQAPTKGNYVIYEKSLAL